MITLFLSPSCTSCRKARAWLSKHEVAFEEHNIITSPLNKEELLQILSFTENGTEDIISTRSKVFQKLAIDVDELSTSSLMELISENPSLLRRPIILDKKRRGFSGVFFVAMLHCHCEEPKATWQSPSIGTGAG